MNRHPTAGSVPPAPRRRRRWGVVLVLLVVFVAVLLGTRALTRAGALGGGDGSAQESNPFAGRAVFAWPHTPAAAAAGSALDADRPVLQRLAGVPTALWLTPEKYPSGKVGELVDEVVDAAHDADAVPVLVVYGITGRDCTGGESSGGLPEDEYVPWVQQVADAAGDDAVVVLEPDALASADECGLREQRVRLLGQAVDVLAPSVATYVDAGHSHWIDPAQMADLLKAVGVQKVRGFAVNVSGYESDDDERAYADTLAASVGSAHYVVDTGRNGVGSNGEWCNPQGRALGAEPGAVDDGGAMDARLWIKPPGESDGQCNGGPVAGEFWPERAVELAHQAGW